jgi:exopolyphosphatase / guanosine-5'-triphosphate,3'-diphosphate pyrophosphatase
MLPQIVGPVVDYSSVDGLAAALDLGSNSFHLIIARLDHGELIAIERLKEKVQLGRGSSDGAMTAPAIQRGLDCVARLAQRIRSIPLERVAIVGTAALREAANRDAFLSPAAQLLGCPIRILSGEEEAELIFLGVSHALAAGDENRVVIDIGGGSTEFCAGHSFAPRHSASVDLGCVSLSDRWFGAGTTLARGYRDARHCARELLLPIAAAWKDYARDALVIGTSGTIESVQSVLVANGFASGTITRAGVAELERAIVERRWVSDLSIQGLAPERVDIFPSGLAALAAILEVLDVERVEFVDASLQHGLLYDLTARRTRENVQERTIDGWQRRFDVDRDQARRVRRLALSLFDQVSRQWRMTDDSLRSLLGWAADLHEIGLMVSSRHPNRHAAYLIENGDLPGFKAEGRRAIALLVRSHRGGFPMFALASFEQPDATHLKRLAILLRLAVILERTRTDCDSPNVTVEVREDRIEVAMSDTWLADHALSRFELAGERERLGVAGIALSVVSTR